MTSDIPGLVEAFKAAEYRPGDCPVVPVKVAAFMDAFRAAMPLLTRLSSPVDVVLETTSEELTDLTDWVEHGVLVPELRASIRHVLNDRNRALAACAAKDAEIAAEKGITATLAWTIERGQAPIVAARDAAEDALATERSARLKDQEVLKEARLYVAVYDTPENNPWQATLLKSIDAALNPAGVTK